MTCTNPPLSLDSLIRLQRLHGERQGMIEEQNGTNVPRVLLGTHGRTSCPVESAIHLLGDQCECREFDGDRTFGTSQKLVAEFNIRGIVVTNQSPGTCSAAQARTCIR